MKKELPLCLENSIPTECWSFYRFAIIEAYPHLLPWTVQHYQHIFSNYGWELFHGKNGEKYNQLSYYDDVLTTIGLSHADVPSFMLNSFIKKNIDKGIYPLIECDYSWYYFIDMTMRLNKHRHTIAPETGNLRDYLVSRPFANIFLRAKTIAAYTEYIAKYQKLQHRTFLFSYCPQSFAPPLSLSTKEDKIHILYPNNCKIEIVNEHEAEGLYSYEFVPPPQKKPCWIKLKDLSISER